MLLPSQKCPGGQLSQTLLDETNSTFLHLMTSALLHASLVPLPGRELGRVENVRLHRWHVALELAPRVSEKVLARQAMQLSTVALPLAFEYVPAGHFCGDVVPRCGQYEPAGQSTQKLSFCAPPTGAAAMYVPLAHVNGHMYWPRSVLYDPASHGMQADDAFCPVFALAVPLEHS